MSIKALVGLCCITLSNLVWAAGDLGIKPPDKTLAPAADKASAARCATEAVNSCRNACETKKFEATTKPEIAKKQLECKQDCIRGC